MKNVLVTGGCGFIGSNFINYMVNKYRDVWFVNLDALYYCASTNNMDNKTVTSKNYIFEHGRLQDRDFIMCLLTTYCIDTVVHFAAQSHVDNSFTDSLAYTYDNVYGTHVLIECCKEYGKIERFVHISTDEVYGESDFNDTERKTEKSLLCPTNPYAATKAAAEMLVMSYYYSFKLPIVITRGNNVYGPRQYPEKVIPKFIYQLCNGQPCTVTGDGQARRAFVYVDDVVRAVETIVLKGQIGEVYNIGVSEEISMIDLAHYLIDILGDGNKTELVKYVEDRKFNDKRYYICDQKLKALGWECQTDFKTGIEKTIEWYLKTRPQIHWNNDSHIKSLFSQKS